MVHMKTNKDKDEEQEEDVDLPDYKKSTGSDVKIGGPMAFWLFFLLIGLAIVVILPALKVSYLSSASIAALGAYILGLPGDIILPLIVSVWIAERIGSLRKDSVKSTKLALINALYASLVYVIAIFIVYLMIYYAVPSFTANQSPQTFLIAYIAIPVAIVIVVTPLFSVLSAARRSSK